MHTFSVLEIGYLRQCDYAYYDVVAPVTYSTPAPMCPRCGASSGRGLDWAAPRIVDIKQPKHIGDFLYGSGGADFLVSCAFMEAIKRDPIQGIRNAYAVDVRQMGTRRTTARTSPTLYGVELVTSKAEPAFDQMDVAWSPEQTDCPLCSEIGPGWWDSYERVVIDDTKWAGEDIFYATNLPGVILLSEVGKSFVERHAFTNCTIIPANKARCSWLETP